MSELIFGHSWDDIQAMQNKTYKPRIISVPHIKPVTQPMDLKLLEEHGIDGLKKLQYDGVLDRLRNSGHIQ